MVVGEFTQETDLVVIGGGPAGYSAAFRAAELGVHTVIVDSHPAGLGGVCLHDGCIPSKTMLHIAEIIRVHTYADVLGVKYTKPNVSLSAMGDWVQLVTSKLAAGLESIRKKHDVERIEGMAHFEDARTLAVPEGSVQRIRFKRAVIATGCVPRAHPVLTYDKKQVTFPEVAWRRRRVPNSLLVVGATYLALELATIFSALGSRVTLVDEGDRLLPEVDPDLTRPLIRGLTESFESILVNTRVTGSRTKKGLLHVSLSGANAPKTGTFELALIATGHQPRAGDLHLERAQLDIDAQGFIKVDQQMRTSNPRIFAAGDITGPPLLADKALHQGRIAAEVIAGRDSVFDPRAIPAAIFTDPQIGWCGLTEDDAKAHAMPHAVAKVPWGASGRAVGMGRSDGLTKIIYDPHSQLVLGVGLVGQSACEMIAQGALAIEMGATLTDLAATIHPHPTLSELLSDAARHAEQADDRARSAN